MPEIPRPGAQAVPHYGLQRPVIGDELNEFIGDALLASAWVTHVIWKPCMSQAEVGRRRLSRAAGEAPVAHHRGLSQPMLTRPFSISALGVGGHSVHRAVKSGTERGELWSAPRGRILDEGVLTGRCRTEDVPSNEARRATMKKRLILALRIIITSVLIAPVVLLALENPLMGPIKSPRQKLVGAWETVANTGDGRLRFSFNIHEDGTVEGTVGTVAMQDARLMRTRHWFSALLGKRRDYEVVGRLQSSPTEKPRQAFWIEFNLDRKGTMTRIKAGLRD